MRSFSFALAMSTTLLSAAPAFADHWLQTADPQVVAALDELLATYGAYCSNGNQMACQMQNQAYQSGAMMLNANYDCIMYGNQQACYFYQQSLGELQQALGGIQQAAGPQAGGGGVNPLGETHAQRMEAIANWGQQQMNWGAQQSAINDANHERFLETIRQ